MFIFSFPYKKMRIFASKFNFKNIIIHKSYNFMVKRLQTKMLLLLALLFVGAGTTWGKVYTSTLNFTEKCNGLGVADDGVEWTVNSDAVESDFDNEKGIHYGTNGKAVSFIQLSTSAFTEGKITKIIVEASGNNDPTLSITVGGEVFGTNQTANTSNAAYTFKGSANAGDVVVRLAKASSAKRALYIKSVVVTYETGYDPQLAYSEESVIINQGDQLNAPMLTFADNFEGTISYASSDENVATIDENGEVTIEGAGNTIITASYIPTEDDDWISSSASYTLRVMSPDAPVGISFGKGKVEIDGSSVTGIDSYGNTWTITTETEGEEPYFSQADDHSQVGSKKNPATSITFTTTLPDTYTIIEFSATFAGSSNKAKGLVTLTVGESTETGNINGNGSVTVTFEPLTIGKTLTVTVTNTEEGINCYNISYKVIAPIEITMNQYGLMSYAFDKALDFSVVEGLTAYAATDIDGTELTMTEVEQAAAGMGLMLEGAEGTYSVPVAIEEPVAVSNNLLVGLTEVTTVPQVHSDDCTTFILAYKESEGVNWYKLDETSYNLKKNSAYLKLNAEQVAGLGNGARGLTMVFGSDTNGIENVQRETTNNQYFDLSGRRVAQPTKGLYIVNGKKVYIK